jgi:hypothetical protein
MEQYRTYLQAELSKLGRVGDAREFLAKSGCEPGAFGMEDDAGRLARAFASQELVDAYVARLDPQLLVDLTACCGRWRSNGIEGKLSPGQRCERVSAPVETIILGQAEVALRGLWSRNGWRLVPIARDPEVLAAAPYSFEKPGSTISFRTCLATQQPDGPFRVFDGIHRAIQMMRNGDREIPLLVVHDG